MSTMQEDNLINLLDGYVEKGGHHLNVNVFNRETLLDAQAHPENEYIVATESGILHEMQRSCPDTSFYPVPPEVSEGSVGCQCNECEFMKMNSLLKIYNALKYEWPTVEVDEAVAKEAVKSINRMLELS